MAPSSEQRVNLKERTERKSGSIKNKKRFIYIYIYYSIHGIITERIFVYFGVYKTRASKFKCKYLNLYFTCIYTCIYFYICT